MSPSRPVRQHVLRGTIVAATLWMATSSALAQTISAPATVTGRVNSSISVTASASGSGFIELHQTNNAPFLAGPSSAGPATNPSITLTGIPTFCQAGTYTVTFTSGTATATTTVIVTPIPPSCSAGSNYQGTLGSPICFNADPFVTPCSGPNTYTWDFGDGSTGTGLQACHAYARCGRYNVTLTVLDTKIGVSTTCTATADVSFLCNATLARCPSDSSPINLNSNPDICISIQPVGACFAPGDVGSVTMTYAGRSISSDPSLGTPSTCPSPGTVCFRKADLVSLFSSLPNGKTAVTVTLGGTFSTGSNAGCGFQATLGLEIQK